MTEQNKTTQTKRNVLSTHQLLTYQEFLQKHATKDSIILNINAWFVLYLYSVRSDTGGFDN